MKCSKKRTKAITRGGKIDKTMTGKRKEIGWTMEAKRREIEKQRRKRMKFRVSQSKREDSFEFYYNDLPAAHQSPTIKKEKKINI